MVQNLKGVYLELWGVRALTINDYWSRGPKVTFIFYTPKKCALQIQDTLVL